MGWLVLLPALALRYVISKRANPGSRIGQDIVSVLIMVVCAAAGCGLAFTWLGQWIGAAAAWPGTLAHSRDVGLGVAIGLMVITIGGAALDIAFDRRADRGAQLAAIVFPTLLLLLLGGVAGHTGGSAVQHGTQQMAAFMHTLGGK